MKRFRKIKECIYLLAAFLLAAVPQQAWAQNICPLDTLKPSKVKSLELFKKIPLINEGRIKPLETFAESFLLRLSGKRSYADESALEWFSRFLFAPRTSYQDKIFLINNPEILEAINVEPQEKRRYSYNQLEAGYDKLMELAESVKDIEEKELSVVEAEVLRLFGNLQYYIRLSGAFAYAFPHPDFDINSQTVKQTLELPLDRDKFSYYDIFMVRDKLAQVATSAFNKGPSVWNEDEQRIAALVNALMFWDQHYSNIPLGLIPTISHEDDQWFSPMDIILLNIEQPDYFQEVTQIRNMTIHYWNNSQLEFDIAAKAYLESIKKRLSPGEKEVVDRFSLELLYNHLKLFEWAKLFYGLGFMFLLFSLMSTNKILVKCMGFFTILGFIPHLSALILRIMIMARPPVSNLFETFIFVGLICAILGFIIEAVNKNQLGYTITTTCGLIFLMISGKFSSDGDTMQMLVAVLDSNFWLSTHVTSITIGYAGASVAGIMGHIYILQACFRPNDKKRLETIFKNMMGILGFGLTMTFLGTALGGIWADQSWGRFWGWDPKENGALLIFLWCAILFHARLARLIHPLGVAVGCAMTLLVVMWAWFGVNLLSVGLHSYGFTSGIANALIAFVAAEFIFIALTVGWLGTKNVKV
ncbi:MAG TPA: cytochrome c biogenesis protein CcsA [Candidatus Omnitrophota bacterium]|nr:cytochrome c biogenesis protein CcsA [Candidatus Omnitrophota bacterium]